MKSTKLRLDFSAHCSVVVEVPDGDNAEDLAVEIAEKYLTVKRVRPMWELDDDGIEEADPSEKAVNFKE